MKTAAATALKEEANMREKEKEDNASHCMLEEDKFKRKEDKNKKAAAATASKEEAKRIANAPASVESEEKARGENKKSQEKEGLKDNVTHININDHLKALNSGAGSKDDDTDNMEEDHLPQKKKLREINKRENNREYKEKERSHSPDPASSPSILKEG